jgi:ribonuclease/clavin/mitogillin
MSFPRMPSPPCPTIVNVGYKSTNVWVVSVGTARLLVDLGWPGTMGTLRAMLARHGVPLHELRAGFATHFHIDHAGLAQDLKLAGVPLLVADVQVPFIARIMTHVKPADHFTPITLHDNHVTSIEASRHTLAGIGIPGQLIHTPGHSPDSVSLLLDGGAVFTGDLTHPSLMTETEAAETLDSWRRLQRLGATTVYAGHGPVRPFPSDLI